MLGWRQWNVCGWRVFLKAVVEVAEVKMVVVVVVVVVVIDLTVVIVESVVVLVVVVDLAVTGELIDHACLVSGCE